MKFPGPHSLVFALMRMDPVTMVQHFNDPDLTARAQAINPRKYLVLLDTVCTPSSLRYPFIKQMYPSRTWVSPCLTTLGSVS